MKIRAVISLLIIFCLIFTNFVAVDAGSELEGDPLVPGWSRDVRITNASGDSLHPAIAVDSKGYTHIVWQDARTGSWKIYYARSINGGETWEEKIIADVPACGDHMPDIITDQNDVIHIVWRASADGTVEGYEIYYKNSTDSGVTMGNEKRLTYASGRSFTPKIAVCEKTLHVVWSDKRDGNFEIYYKRSTDEGKSWSEDVRLTMDEGDSKVPSIVVDLLGQVHVVWYDKRGKVYKIYYTYSRNGGMTWENETCITQDHGLTTLIADYPELIVDSYNDIHLFWQGGPFGKDNIFYKKKSNDLWMEEKK